MKMTHFPTTEQHENDVRFLDGRTPPSPCVSKTLQQAQPGVATLRGNAAGLFGTRLGSLWNSLLGARLGLLVWESQSYRSTK